MAVFRLWFSLNILLFSAYQLSLYGFLFLKEKVKRKL